MAQPDLQPDLQPDPDPKPALPRGRRGAAFLAGAAVFGTLLGFTTWHAFERDSQPPALAAIESTTPDTGGADVQPIQVSAATASLPSAGNTAGMPLTTTDIADTTNVSSTAPASTTHPSQTRDAELIVDGQPWTGPTFDGRPIRPVRTVTMRTTAYSPDERSCGEWADGITASGMSVWTNGMKLAAADPSIPFGTILTVPGYNDGHPIPVLDRGGAIKGNRLDLLYPTHDIALQWGVQDLEVVVWEYADE